MIGKRWKTCLAEPSSSICHGQCCAALALVVKVSMTLFMFLPIFARVSNRSWQQRQRCQHPAPATLAQSVRGCQRECDCAAPSHTAFLSRSGILSAGSVLPTCREKWGSQTRWPVTLHCAMSHMSALCSHLALREQRQNGCASMASLVT